MYLRGASEPDVLKVENPRAPNVMCFVFFSCTVEGDVQVLRHALTPARSRSPSISRVPRLRDLLLGTGARCRRLHREFQAWHCHNACGFDYATLPAQSTRVSSTCRFRATARTGPSELLRRLRPGCASVDRHDDGLTARRMARPPRSGFPVIDIATGMLGAMSVLAALHSRHSDAVSAAHIDTSLAHAALQLMRPLASSRPVDRARRSSPRQSWL